MASPWRETKYDCVSHHQRLERVCEHGQDWLVCHVCGATWSVVECEDAAGTYEDLERIDQGDESCEEGS